MPDVIDNPRYLLFLRAENTTPEQEAERCPGGEMCGYILWTQARWQEWKAANGYAPHEGVDMRGHSAFDRWLESWVTLHQGGVE